MTTHTKQLEYDTELILKELRHMSKYPANFGWVPGAAADLIEDLLKTEPDKINQND